MKYLLYCIFSNPNNQISNTLTGVDGQPVVLVENNGISAAVSGTAHSSLEPDVERILAYKSVIESFHRDRTLIPMRYGCLLKDKEQIVRLLAKNQTRYEALLKKLDNCVEMGIRLLIDESGFPLHTNRQPAAPMNRDFRCTSTGTSGRAYLAARKIHYGREDKFSREIDAIINQYREGFAGLYVDFKTEYTFTGNSQGCNFSLLKKHHNYQALSIKPTSPRWHKLRRLNRRSRNGFLSIYFLVPRQSVARFRSRFRNLFSGRNVKHLLSGPWPPYNFVMPDRFKDRLALLFPDENTGNPERVQRFSG